MPAQDKIHDAVKNALIKDGWTITADPYRIKYEEASLFVDLGAERTLGAERGEERIVVEIKSFLGPSKLQDVEIAVGQYTVYRSLLELTDPQRKLFLAVTDMVYNSVLSGKAVQWILARSRIAVLVVRLDTEEVKQWIKPPDTENSSNAI
jgi:hypothetical protein